MKNSLYPQLLQVIQETPVILGLCDNQEYVEQGFPNSGTIQFKNV